MVENKKNTSVTFPTDDLYYIAAVRALFNIIRTAAINVIDLDNNDYKDIIIKKDIEKAIPQIAGLPYLTVMRRIKALKFIKDNKTEPDKEYRQDFIDSILDNTIYVYFNDIPWYEVNPLIEKGVEVYSINKN